MSRFFSTSGAPAYIRSPVLYERKPVTHLWNRLTTVSKQQWKWKNLANKEDPDFMQCRQRFLLIYGPPGSGKSSATFRWLWSVCEINKAANAAPVQAVWVNCAASKEQSECWTIGRNAGVGRVETVPTQTPQNVSDVDFADIVVFDGIRAGSVEQWRALMNGLARRGVAAVIVSSEGSITLLVLRTNFGVHTTYYGKFKGGTSDDDMNQRRQLIGNKFTVAGHSAPFMFTKCTFEIEQKTHLDAGAMGGIDSLEKALRNICYSGAINTMLTRLQVDKNGTTPQQPAAFPTAEDLLAVGVSRADFDPLEEEIDKENALPRLVSAFASKEVIKNIPSSIEKLRNIARKLSNKAIEGYAFEQQLEKSLREAANPG